MEVCIDNIQSAINAAASGASRIELCTALSEGGLTPSVGFLKIVKQLVHIPIFVMLRPRRGNFVYTKDELDILKQDAIELKNAGADGVVFGILKEDGTIDEQSCQDILNITRPLPATFHRAFDVLRDPTSSLDVLINLGFSRVLTSGQKPRAEDGLDLIRQLVELSQGRIIIMPGSGVNENNIGRIMETGVREVHASARSTVRLNFQSDTEVAMGSSDDNELLVTDVKIVRTIVSVVNKFVN
ncbi:copper homeostasis protein cutC homolog [Planococcus citri]|uniref:copper homeostasis protein cutC homolog n=1 Tax=Planococcus citri TaxID=170843 RepID=UPI0031F9E32C